MNETELYLAFFENNTRFFWPEIMRRKRPLEMAEAIERKLWSIAGIIKATCGCEILGHWVWQFSILTSDLAVMSTPERARKEIARFRACATVGRTYQRLPEDQSALFRGEKWSNNEKR